MPVALYWLLDTAANDLHRDALRAHAITIAGFLRPQPDGGLTMDIPSEVRPLYSGGYGLYAYAVLDSTSQVLLFVATDKSAFIHADLKSRAGTGSSAAATAGRCCSASACRPIGDRIYWIQVGQDLAHRDVIIDDVVASFFPRVAWITFPILLLLLVIDILIFRRALDPVREASTTGMPSIGPEAHRVAATRAYHADRGPAAGPCRQPGARPPRSGLPRPARLHRRHGA